MRRPCAYVVQYAYDAWGRLLSKTGSMASTLGTLNPFRYRGYVYDEETGLYYLRSRYFNPTWCRFVNADKIVKGNLYAYCSNQPITRYDPSGFESFILTDDPAVSSVKYPNTVMPVKLFVDLITQAVTNKDWKYVYGHSKWKETDCVGLPKYILNWYYSFDSFKKLSKIKEGKNKGKIYNQVKDLAVYGMQYQETCEIESFDEIPIGAAVYIYNPEHKRANKKNMGWIHVGVFIGEWGDYEYAVAQAASADDGVGIWPITDEFTRYGLFEGVDYR